MANGHDTDELNQSKKAQDTKTQTNQTSELMEQLMISSLREASLYFMLQALTYCMLQQQQGLTRLSFKVLQCQIIYFICFICYLQSSLKHALHLLRDIISNHIRNPQMLKHGSEISVKYLKLHTVCILMLLK